MDDEIITRLAYAIIYSAYEEYEREKRTMIRIFKNRHKYYYVNGYRYRWKYQFHRHLYNYQNTKKFFQNNMWFEFLDIEPDYFKKLMEEKEHERIL